MLCDGVRSAITPAQRAIPKFKFAVMGLLDSIAGIMGVFAVNYINNAAMIVLLQQAAIPISMSISKFFLGAKYTVNQVRNLVCSQGRLHLIGYSLILQPW